MFAQREGLFVLAVLLLSVFSYGTTIVVDQGGQGDYTTIQAAINVSNDGDEIVIHPATYHENINFNGKNITVRSSNPLDWDAVESTIIDGTGTTNTVELGWSAAHPVLSGLTITGGTNGIFCNGMAPEVNHCIITDNSQDGIYVIGNTVAINCILKDNGFNGVELWQGSCILKNDLIYENQIGFKQNMYSGATVSNCTFTNNVNSGITKAPMYANAAITNCILWDNGNELENCTATYSCIKDGTGGTGNISENPLFVDAENGDFHLLSASPCLDAGSNEVVSAGDTDIDNDTRIIFGTVDIGAEEVLIWISGDYKGEKWLSGSGINGIAAGTDAAFGADVYISQGSNIVRITGKNTSETFATGLPNAGKIAFDSGSFGGKMFVSGATASNPTADPIYQITSSGQVSTFFSSSTYKVLTNGITFGKGGTFGTDLYVQDAASNKLLRITPSGSASLFGNDVFAESVRDDLEATNNAGFGTYIYMTHLADTRMYRMSQSGINTQFGSSGLNNCSMTFGEGVFSGKMFVGTEQGEVWAYTSSGTKTIFARGFSSTIRDIDVANNIMWVATPYAVYRISPVSIPTTYYVTVSGDDNASGLSPEDAFATIQRGIGAAADGDTVCVYPGTYEESVDFIGKAITVRGTDPEDWDVVENTIITASDWLYTVGFLDGEDASSILTGFTITSSTNLYLGAVTTSGSSPVISRCIIRDNSIGIHMTCNSAPAPLIQYNKIYNNGTAIWSETGVGVSIKNNWIYDNADGIVFVQEPAAGEVTNNTIVNNIYDGIHCRYTPSGALEISNCILWGNGNDLYSCSATYSCIEDGDAGTGNIGSDPNFVDAVNGNYHLLPTSPCMNSGNNAVVSISDKDIDNDDRVRFGTIDMGADEIDVWVEDGYYAEKWLYSSGMNGIAAGPGGAFGTDVYVSQGSNIVRITGKNSSVTFATGLPNAGKIAFDSGSFGGKMFVSGATISNPTADPIYQITSSGQVSTFFSSSSYKLLTMGIAFGKGGTFGTDLYVQDAADNAILRITPAGSASLFGSNVQALSVRDDLEITMDTAYGTYIYMTDLWGTQIYRMNGSGTNVQFGSSQLASRALTFGEGAFGNTLFAGTDQGEVWALSSTGAATIFASGIPGIIEDIDVANDTMWVVTNKYVYRISPMP